MLSKVICFGLGDINRCPESWVGHGQQNHEPTVVDGPLLYHAIAHTVYETANSFAKAWGRNVRLLTQDPGYTGQTQGTLRGMGWEVVGEHGAGGFAEIDDESIVISPFTSAPVTQIMADLA